MDEYRLRRIAEGLSLSLWLVAARLAADPPQDPMARARAESGAEEEARDLGDRAAALISAAALAGFMAELRKGYREIAADAKRHGKKVSAEPTPLASRVSFEDLVSPLRDPANLWLVGHDGTETPFREAVDSYIAEAVATGAGNRELAVEMASRCADRGSFLRVGNAGVQEITGYLRNGIFTRYQREAYTERMRWAAGNGATHVRITVHSNCARDHLDYQGRKYTIAGFQKLNDGLERPIATGEYNCRHSAMPAFDYTPAYDEADIRAARAESLRRVTYTDGNGKKKTCTAYEATQVQRRYEASIRRAKQGARILRAMGESDERLQRSIRARAARYRSFCSSTGLKPDMRRTQIYELK